MCIFAYHQFSMNFLNWSYKKTIIISFVEENQTEIIFTPHYLKIYYINSIHHLFSAPDSFSNSLIYLSFYSYENLIKYNFIPYVCFTLFIFVLLYLFC